MEKNEFGQGIIEGLKEAIEFEQGKGERINFSVWG